MKFLILLGSSLFLADSALAQGCAGADCIVIADPIRDDLITVVATGSQARLSATGQAISVIPAHEIASLQGPDLTRVLERLPGVTISRNGGLGNFTGVRVRGAEAEQLLVLVDGVRVADVAAPGGGYDFGNLSAGGISKVELLRGSNSVIWGSEAMGGVLALSSRELAGLETTVEYGARGSVDSSAAGGIAGDGYALSLSGGYTRTDGISQAAVGSEPDGFRQWYAAGRARAELGGNLEASLMARYTDGRLDIDGFPAPAYAFADTPEYQKTRAFSARAGLRWSGEALSLNGGLALADTRRSYFDPGFGPDANYATAGRNERAELSGEWRLPARFTLDFGADTQLSRFSSLFDPEVTARLSSGHVLLRRDDGVLRLAASARIDRHSRFGMHWTFGANGSLELGAGWRMRASYGEGFKAPTLFQLLSNYGNTALRPERSKSYDIGIERGDRNGALHVALTAYRRDSGDLIDFVSCYLVTVGICANRPDGTYDNVATARAEGFELEADALPTERLALHAAYSYTQATNRLTGRALARRPRHALSVSVDWRSPLHDLTLGADVRLVSDSYDSAFAAVPLDGHSLLILRAELPVNDVLSFYGRVENVMDVQYQTAAGYGTAGRSVYVGVRARL